MKNALFSLSKKTVALVLIMLMVITFVPFAPPSMTAEAASRQSVVSYMRSMSAVKWSTDKSITYWAYRDNKNETRKYKAGVTYTGMPYTQINRKNLSQFQSQLKGTAYIGPKSFSNYYGNDCSWAVRCAWEHAGEKVAFSSTAYMFPGNTGIKAVGSYNVSSKSSTASITKKNGKNTMYAAYAQLKPGDAIMKRVDGKGHTRLVVSVSGSGASGKVTVIEQCGLSGSKTTTWNVDKTYTFENLYSTWYIPITCPSVQNAPMTDTPPTGPSQLKIANYNKPPANLPLGKSYSIYGTITSNYKIKSVTVGIYSANGTPVSTKTANPNSTSFSISTVDNYIKFAKAKAGKNKYKITAVDEKATKTLVDVSFTVGSGSGGGSGSGSGKSADSTLSVKDYNYPSELKQGSSYTIKGTVTSNYKITSLTVGVYNANGGAVSTKTVSPNAKSYSISKVDSYVKFGQAKAGTNYYKIRATDEKGTKTLLNKAFTVAGSGNSSAANEKKSSLTIKNYNYPTTLTKGQPYTIKGDVMSNYNITNVTVGIYNSNGTAVSTKTAKPNSKTYSIANLHSFIKFGKAALGKNYYKVSATDKKKTSTLLNKSFTVESEAEYIVSKSNLKNLQDKITLDNGAPFTTINAESTLKLEDFNYPTILYNGESFTSKGKISSKYKITAVTVGIYNEDGKKIKSKTVNPDAKSYSLKKINEFINFGDSKVGNNYYKVAAKDENSAVTLVNQPYTVKKSACYKTYKDVKSASDYGGCNSMQALAVGSKYLYTVKINDDNSKAIIYKTTKDGATQTRLKCVTNGKESDYITGLAHANDMCVTTIDNKSTLFIATGTNDNNHYSIVKMQVNGSKISKVGNYNVEYEGNKLTVSAIALIEKTDKDITFFFKCGKNLYKGTVGINKKSGTITATKACTLNVTEVLIDGKYEDLSSYLFQGMSVSGDKLYVPMSGTGNKENISVIAVYENIKNASGKIKSSPALSFKITSKKYKYKFEIESCGICSSDGCLYFNTNRRSTTQNKNEDGIHCFKDYTK